MYTIKFLEYNDLMKKVMSEEDTLDNALTNLDKPTNQDKLHLTNVEKWAKYAFDNEKEYYTTIFQNEKPIACIDNYFLGIRVDFLTYNQGELFIYLSMFYKKHEINNDKNEHYTKYSDNRMFLRQINLVEEDNDKKITNEMLFKDDGILNVETITETKLPEFNINYEEKETKVNLSHNWLRVPKNCDDYEYLLDYKNILKPEYLNLTNDN
jgi:hypothetical protein